MNRAKILIWKHRFVAKLLKLKARQMQRQINKLQRQNNVLATLQANLEKYAEELTIIRDNSIQEECKGASFGTDRQDI